MTTSLQCILYVSDLAGEVNVHGITQVFQSARQFATNNGISGVLIFDGIRFCEYLEGSADRLGVIWTHIQRDARHTNLQVLHEEPVLAQRRMAHWSVAYAMRSEPSVVQRMAQLRGLPAVEHLQASLPELDMV